MPFEASVSVSASGSGGFRYLTETATAAPFFVPRLVAQRATIDDLVALLPPPAAACRDDLHQFVDRLFPQPAAVPTRSRIALWFGLAHHPAVPGRPAGLKIYGNASVSGDVIGRLAEWRHEYRTHALGDEFGLAPKGASYEIDAAGSTRHKLYWRADPRLGPDAVLSIAKSQGVEGAADVRAALDDVVGESGSDNRLFLGNGFGGSNLAVHVRTRDWDVKDSTQTADHVLQLTDRCIGHTQPVSDLFAAMEAVGWPWQCTVVGFGLGPDGPTKVNVYAAPVAQ